MTDAFSEPEADIYPPDPAIARKLAQALAIRKGRESAGEQADEGLVRFVAAEVEAYRGLRPAHGMVAGALQALPPRAANRLLAAWRRMLANGAKMPEAPEGPRVGLIQTELEDAVSADVDSKGAPRVCMLCGGVRWMRMTNHGPDEVQVESTRQNGSKTLHTYDPGETWLIPCGHCSLGRKKKLDARASGARSRRKTDREYVEEGL